MNEQYWYVYHGGQQLGPFEASQVQQMISSKMIAQEAYLFKVGWKDWRPMADAMEDLGMAPPENIDQAALEESRKGAPRATIKGRVVVHNNGKSTIGEGADISQTGMFVETDDHLFTIGETLKVSVRCDGLEKAFNAMAQVIRYNSDERYPVGYGLRFVDLEKDTQDRIQQLVADVNASSAVKQA